MTGLRLRLTRLRGVRAVTDLGQRLAATGDVRGAADAFRLAIDSGDVTFGLHAALNLWVLHAEQGNARQSREAFREAIRFAAAAKSTSTGEACVHIGDMLGADYSFLPGASAARLAFETTISSGDRDLAPKAALGYAMMLWGLWEPPEETRAAFRIAIDSGHPECVETAEKWLAKFQVRSGAEVSEAAAADDGADEDDGIAPELDRNLSICPSCTSLYIVNWMVFPEDGDGCDECDPTVRGATDEAGALGLTGWSQERLLLEAYVVSTEINRMHPHWGAGPFMAGIEDRLGMARPVPGEGPGMEQTKLDTVATALDVFRYTALPSAPMVDEARVRAEHFLLRRSWNGPGLWDGSAEEITAILRTNLERNAALPGHSGIIVNAVVDQYCAQVVSVLGNKGLAYRIWRTPDRLWFYSSRSDTVR